MPQEKEVLNKLSVIIDPDLGQDIVTLGFIKDLKIVEGEVSFAIELTTPACPIKEEFRSRAKAVVAELDWVSDVNVEMTAQASQPQKRAGGLSQVRNIIAVSSCKGGVGKSTTAVNLACAISRTGASVGIFDADIFGPSLPTMVKLDDVSVYQQENLIVPLDYQGIKLMSFGFVNPEEGRAAIMRGPMVSNVVTQLLTGTAWGELDYLIIDMPPGTGDVQLTISQQANLTAAVIVTTPQNLSFVDVIKGIQMFDTLKVPTVAAVQNMSYFKTPDGESHQIFGPGCLKRLVDQYGFKHAFEFPILPELSQAGDSGVPAIVSAPNGEIARLFSDLASSTVREIARLQHEKLPRPKVTNKPGIGVHVRAAEGEAVIASATLRRACRCAHCVDEMTGAPLLKPEDVKEDIEATSIEPVGNYAVAIHWSDGHSSSIYPYDTLISYVVQDKDQREEDHSQCSH